MSSNSESQDKALSKSAESHTAAHGAGDGGQNPFNVPNMLCAVRLAGAPVMLYLAYAQQSTAFLFLFGFLLLTDWLDGKLAILLNQRTSLGARLDSLADATLAGSLILSVGVLLPEVVQTEIRGILAVALSYAASVALSLAKFGRLPSYHTWTAKGSWWLVSVGAIALFLDGPVWPIRVAMAAVVIANLEAAGITLVLREWRADVRSVLPLLRSSDDR